MDEILEMIEDGRIVKLTIDKTGPKIDIWTTLLVDGNYVGFQTQGSYIEQTLDKVIENINGREDAKSA